MRFDPIYDYLATLPTISYFPFLACNLRDLVIKLNDEVISDDNFKLLNDIHDEILDLILYVQDIFSLKIQRINYILINSLFYYLVLPLLVGSIVSISKVNPLRNPAQNCNPRRHLRPDSFVQIHKK